jgi:hypothetical protein
MYKAKLTSPSGEEHHITAPTEWELHRKVRQMVGRLDTKFFSTTSLRGGHTLIKGGGWEIILYCSGK